MTPAALGNSLADIRRFRSHGPSHLRGEAYQDLSGMHDGERDRSFPVLVSRAVYG